MRAAALATRNLICLAKGYICRQSRRQMPTRCGRSSGVERNLAKVEVVGSNPIARSIFPLFFQHFMKRAEIEFGTERQNVARTCTAKRAKSVQFVADMFSRAMP